MFAYCENSPVTNVDSHGNMKQRVKDVYGVSVGGGGAAGAGALVYAAIDQFAKEAAELLAQTKARAAAKRRENKNREYSVYFLTEADSTSDKIVYVGRVKTANMGPRMNYHRTKNREFAYSIDNLTYSECRILEQAGMSYHHSINRGNAVNNQIRGISITNGSAFLEVIKVFTDSIDYVDNEFLPSSYIVNQYENWLLNGG